MSINKLALIRYKTINECLQNRFRKWTIDDLTEAVAEALYEYEGMTKGISKRTVQLDLQNMRSEKLGYNAPIVVQDKKFYSYADKNYSITNTPITNQDLDTLGEVLSVLKQFKGFSYFDELNSMVTKLEDKLYRQKNKGQSFIDFEKNDLLKGLEHIDTLHKSIMHRQVMCISYKSFKAKDAGEIVFHPYLLKEYRNRWFILGLNQKGNGIMNLALDRIESVKQLQKEKYAKPVIDVHKYYDDVIGVTKGRGQAAQVVVLKVSKENAPYIITKPLHHSQEIFKETRDWVFFKIKVIWNFELEREILGFGEGMKVISPTRMQSKMKARLKEAIRVYEDRD